MTACPTSAGDVLLTVEPTHTVRSALCVAFGVSARSIAHAGAPPTSRSVIVGGTMLGRDMHALEGEFSDRDGARACQHERVYHVSLTPLTGDHVTDGAWRSLVDRFVLGLGFQAVAYTIVRRELADVVRVHLIAARSDAWGRRITAPGAVQAEDVLAATLRGEEHRVRRNWTSARGERADRR